MTKRNENRPGYKKTRVGWIPKEWDCVRLSVLTTKIGSGITPRGGESAYVQNGIAFIRSQNILNGTFSSNGLAHITPEQHAKMSGSILMENDVLYNITGASIGRCCLLPSCLKAANLNQHVCIIRANGRTIPLFIVSLLNSSIGQKNLYESQAGGGREGLNFENLGAFSIPLPPLPEQKKIAEILSAWDRAIEQMGKLIDAKQQLKKGLIQQLLTGWMRFPEFAGSEKRKVKSEKLKEGELPMGWRMKRLGSFGTFLKGKGISNSEKKEAGFSCITYGEIYTKHEFVIKEFHSFIDRDTAQKSQRIQRNDILFAGSGETLDEIGKCVAHTEDIEAYAGGDIVIFRPKGVNPLYVSYSLNSDLLIRQKRKLGQGHSVVHIYSAGLKTLQVPLPSFKEQTRIASILSTCDQEIELLKKKQEKLKEQKKGLMQKLLTGEVRVQI